jgi:hypothetical protein
MPSVLRFRAKTLTSAHLQRQVLKFKIRLSNQLSRMPFRASKKASVHRFRALLEPLPRPYRDGGSKNYPLLRIEMRGSAEHHAMQTCEHAHIVKETYLNRAGFPIRRWRCADCNQTFTSREMGCNPRALGTNPRARNKRRRKRSPKTS